MKGRAMKRFKTALGLLFATALLAGSAGVATGQYQQLRNDQTLRNLSGSEGSTQTFMLEVDDQEELRITTSGGRGDVDLYLRRNRPPASGEYDYYSNNYGTSEEIVVSNPADGRWYLTVYGYESYRDVDIEVNFDDDKEEPEFDDQREQLSPGQTVRNLSGGRGSMNSYYVEVPAGAESLTIETEGGRGDADLFV